MDPVIQDQDIQIDFYLERLVSRQGEPSVGRQLPRQA